jgi:hypothetical protein
MTRSIWFASAISVLVFACKSESPAAMATCKTLVKRTTAFQCENDKSFGNR